MRKYTLKYFGIFFKRFCLFVLSMCTTPEEYTKDERLTLRGEEGKEESRERLHPGFEYLWKTEKELVRI